MDSTPHCIEHTIPRDDTLAFPLSLTLLECQNQSLKVANKNSKKKNTSMIQLTKNYIKNPKPISKKVSRILP